MATLPQNFSFVAAALVSSFYLLVWQVITVNKYRAKAEIQYPQMYAEKDEVAASEDALKFNCAQRAHQNTLESFPMVVTGTVLTGLSSPRIAAALCAFWVLCRIMYTMGYITGDPHKRLTSFGRFGGATVVSIITASTWTAIDLFRRGV